MISVLIVSVIAATFSATASKLILRLLTKGYYNTFYGVKKTYFLFAVFWNNKTNFVF